MADPTPEQTELLQKLRSALQRVVFVEGDARVDAVGSLIEACIDLEWHSDECHCGVKDRSEGTLELVGIGGWVRCAGCQTCEFRCDHAIGLSVCQWDWQDLDDFRRLEVREAVYALIRRTHVLYQNAIGDIKVMRRHGFEITPADHVDLDDVMLADAVLNSEADHDLGDIGRRYGKLPFGYKTLQHVAPREYNAGDLIEPIYIWRSIEKEFEKDPAAERVYREQSLAYLREIQLEQEEAGIRVAKRVPYVLRDLYSEKRAQAMKLAEAYVGGVEFGLGSSDDLKLFLYGIEGLPAQREKSYGGKPGKLVTDKDAIAELRRYCGTEWDPEDDPTLEAAHAAVDGGGHPLLEARYLYLGAQQALSHYIAPCLVLGPRGDVLGIQDRIYPSTRIHVQETGRHSVVGPALQQFKGPLEDDPLASGGKVPRLQRLICPDPGYFWGGHDWSNIETWLLGGLANDPVILEAKAKGWDTHTANFCDMAGVPYPPILTKRLHDAPECAAWRAAIKWLGDEDPRRVHAKRFVYRLHYLGDPKNATDIPGSKALGFNSDKLVRASQLYLARHPALPVYWATVTRQAERTGVVYSFMGRPRRLTNERPKARIREACNDPMQAGVADIYVTTALEVKWAMPWVRLVWGSHDSMTWSVPIERRAEFRERYKPIVEREFQLTRDVAMSFPASYKEREAV